MRIRVQGLLTAVMMVLALSVQAGDPAPADQRRVLVDLKLAPELQRYAGESWIVYVFARPENKQVPLASKKLTLNRVPLLVELTEQNFLLENLTLANADQVVIYAKVTRHGSPHKTQVGDLLGESETVDFTQGHEQRVELVIDNEVK